MALTIAVNLDDHVVSVAADSFADLAQHIHQYCTEGVCFSFQYAGIGTAVLSESSFEVFRGLAQSNAIPSTLTVQEWPTVDLRRTSQRGEEIHTPTQQHHTDVRKASVDPSRRSIDSSSDLPLRNLHGTYRALTDVQHRIATSPMRNNSPVRGRQGVLAGQKDAITSPVPYRSTEGQDQSLPESQVRKAARPQQQQQQRRVVVSSRLPNQLRVQLVARGIVQAEAGVDKVPGRLEPMRDSLASALSAPSGASLATLAYRTSPNGPLIHVRDESACTELRHLLLAAKDVDSAPTLVLCL